MKYGKKISIFLFFGVIISLFFFWGILLRKEIAIQTRFINYSPSSVPKKESLFLSSFGFHHLRADWIWIQAVQYIGNNATGNYHTYLYHMLENITHMNPYFTWAYRYGQLLLPEQNDPEAIAQAEAIGEKGIQKLCDIKKIRKIQENTSLEELQKTDWGIICPNLDFLISQGFLYFYYLDDYDNASKWYKVATLQKDAPEGIKTLYSLSLGKSGNNVDAARSFSYFANIYTGEEEKECQVLNMQIQKNILPLLKDKNLPGKAVEDIQNLQQEFFPFQEGDFTQSCIFFLQKMIREINIGYLEQEKERYASVYQKYPENLSDLEQIQTFFPTDFQQYDTHGIVYKWDNQKKKITYSMQLHEK